MGMAVRKMGFEKTISEVNGLGEIIQEEDFFTPLNIEDSFILDMIETGSGFEFKELKSKEDEDKPWTAEEQFRLLHAYFKDVGSEPLLTPTEEIELSIEIKKCEAKASEIKALLDKVSNEKHSRGNDKGKKQRQIKRLNVLIKVYSDRARLLKERFMKANLKLVISVARKYIGRGLPLSDLIQEGNLGLIRAVEKFDHTKGNKFSTYAVIWIIQSITRILLDQVRIIKVPAYVLEKANNVYKISSALEKELGRRPLPEEITKEAGISVEHVKQILKGKDDVAHLDLPIGEGVEATLLDFVPDEKSYTPDSVIVNAALTNRIRDALSILSPREEETIRLRFGIDYETTYTLDEIGKKFNLTRERIRQIEKEALKKLATSKPGEVLRSFLE
ncbi:MAG: sigma-70 family RNA polymerase sigma factor [Deltaproteobacteria bacterium]|nr:sigma-70 family RNA polymerase sigma factor [Deltaproteobacteria bacterium]